MARVQYLETHTHKAGVAFAEQQGLSLYLVVLPKSWNPHQNAKGKFSLCSFTWTTDTKALLTLYENQRLKLILDGNEDLKMDVLNRLLDKVSASRSSIDAQVDDLHNYHTELITDITERTFNSTQSKNTLSVSNTESIASILSLLQLVQHSQFNTVDETSFGITKNPMLIPFLHYLFTKEMQTIQRYIRRGYVPQSSKLRSIRGRPDILSVAISQSGGGTELLCHYDEFEESTPLMRVLVTALDIVTGGNWLTRMSTQTSNALTLWNTTEKSLDLRRTLHSIPSMNRHQALTTHKQIRLNRSTQIFSRILTLAKQILQNEPILPTPNRTLHQDAWCWDVDMSNVWESILVQGFQRCQDVNVTHYDHWYINRHLPNTVYTKEIHAPFTKQKQSNRRPDILLTQQTTTTSINWIVDAKYSYFKQVPKNARRNDQNQMFGYTYLIKDTNKPWGHQLALIYTTDQMYPVNKTNKSQIEGAWHIGWSSKPFLHQTLVPFPSVQQVDCQQSWHQYINHISTQLHQFLHSEQDGSILDISQ